MWLTPVRFITWEAKAEDYKYAGSLCYVPRACLKKEKKKLRKRRKNPQCIGDRVEQVSRQNNTATIQEGSKDHRLEESKKTNPLKLGPYTGLDRTFGCILASESSFKENKVSEACMTHLQV